MGLLKNIKACLSLPGLILVRRLAILCLLVLGGGQTVNANPFAGYQWVDLTHTFDANTLYWPTEKGFVHDQNVAEVTEGGWFYASNRVITAEHGGTHLDAPIHFAQGRWSTDEIPLASLIGAAVVIDVKAQALKDRDYLLDVETIQRWEAEHGAIPDEALVLLNTGYAQFWPDRLRYMGTDKVGAEAVPELHFPGFSQPAAAYLSEVRKVKAVGLDTPSIDYGQSADFIVHRYLYERNVIGFENVANLDQLPATGAYVIALPMKIGGGSGGPLRIVALVPK